MKLKRVVESETGIRRTLYNIARRVRRWAEHRARKYRVRDDEDLEGLCDVASRKLYNLLKDAGLDPTIHQAPPGSYSHFYVEVEGYLVDVTASQFGQPKIVIRRMDRVDSKEHWFWRQYKQHKDDPLI